MTTIDDPAPTECVETTVNFDWYTRRVSEMLDKAIFGRSITPYENRNLFAGYSDQGSPGAA